VLYLDSGHAETDEKEQSMEKNLANKKGSRLKPRLSDKALPTHRHMSTKQVQG
jgi:hypothetical protein